MSKTTYFYLSTIDQYLCSDGNLYTEEDLDYFDKEERKWKKSLPNYSFQEWLKIFPKATKEARRGVKEEIKRQKQLMADSDEAREEYYNTVINKAHFSKQAELRDEIEKYFTSLREKRESAIKACVFKLKYLDQLDGKEVKMPTGGVDESDLERAKQVPITSLYTDKLSVHGNLATGKCPFHNEKTGSFTIYLDQNSFYCYGCHNGGSVVDYVMAQQNVNFLSAVKQLIK